MLMYILTFLTKSHIFCVSRVMDKTMESSTSSWPLFITYAYAKGNNKGGSTVDNLMREQNLSHLVVLD